MTRFMNLWESSDFFLTDVLYLKIFLRQGLKNFLEHQLREINTEIFRITGQYNVFDVQEMEARYQEGTLEETDSWRDFQCLDHLGYKQEQGG